jgi:hypothetical protein
MRGRSAGLLLMIAAACAPGESDWGGTERDSAGVMVVQNPPEATWRQQPELVMELRIGDEEGDPVYRFGAVVSIDVDSAGRIHVLDRQAAQVRVFDNAGKHVRTIGGPGAGPGELSPTTMAVLAGPDGVVYVADIMRQRIAAFDLDGREIGSTPMLVQRGIPLRFNVSPDGRFLIQVRAMMLPGMLDTVPMKDRILARDPASEQADTLLEAESGRTFAFSGGGMPRFRLFEPEPVWAVLQDGRLAHGRNDNYRIEVLGEDGTVERVITRRVERRAVTGADRAAILDMMRRALERQLAGRSRQSAALAQQIVEGTQFADHYPLFAALLGGPHGTLWVQRIRTADDAKREGSTFHAQDIGSAQWDVFDPAGRLLGMLQLPAKFQPMHVEGEHIYGVLRDELDVQHVVRLRVVGLSPHQSRSSRTRARSRSRR